MNFGCHLPVYGPAATREVLLGFARRMEAPDLATACRQVGRDMGSLTISARLGLPARQDRDALVREIRELAALGVSHVILESRVRDLDDMTAIYETFARETRPSI